MPSFAEQKKFDEKNRKRNEKNEKKAREIIAAHRNQLIVRVKRIYECLPNTITPENLPPFLDQLYFLDLVLANIIANNNLEKYDPYVKNKIIQLLFTDKEVRATVKPQHIPQSVAASLLHICEAFFEYINTLEDPKKLPPTLSYLIQAHSYHGNAGDHMGQTCNDRSKLIEMFLKHNTPPKPLAEEKSMDLFRPSYEKFVIKYLTEFYGSGLSKHLPAKPQTVEEQILKDVILKYESATKPPVKAYSLFKSSSIEKDAKASPEEVHDLLHAISVTISSYELTYKKIPAYMSFIFWKIHGLMPAPKAVQSSGIVQAI